MKHIHFVADEYRSIRDPIHGDVGLSELESAVVDTRIFQRLRYIRQNGLLHFVFPGAVHTRFAHSIGTLSIAGRVFDGLFMSVLQKANDSERSAVLYLRCAFRLAALLHDVGHCAFSHSIEDVELDGHPILGSLESFFNNWDLRDLLSEYLETHPKAKPADAIEHEQIALALVDRIFKTEHVKKAHPENAVPTSMATDVRALIDSNLDASATLKEKIPDLSNLLKRCDLESDPAALGEDILALLHSLISSTLDVDRLDYLERDSVFLGVRYGLCDTGYLIRNLQLGILNNHLSLMLNDKAEYALEDMLWARYQMFVQIYNHKTNAALNTVLSEAIQDAVGEDRIDPPSTEAQFLQFTDDYVMSKVISGCLKGSKLQEATYTKVLVDRRFPRHLGCKILDVPNEDDPAAEKAALETAKKVAATEKATQLGISVKDLRTYLAKSVLLKGATPTLVTYDRATGTKAPRGFVSKTVSAVKAKHYVVHFFVEHEFILPKNTQGAENENH